MYCGDKKHVPSGYSRKGSSYECLQRGFGIADWTHRKKAISKNSLQQIPYVGPVYEANFKGLGITGITKLISILKSLSKNDKNKLIKKGCTRKNGGIDQKAVNSILMFLHDRGMTNLPNCKIVSE